MGHNVDSYKFDDRTKEQFIADMEKGLSAEVNSIKVFREILRNSTVEKPEVIYVGSEEEGAIIYDGDNVADVDLFPDYLLKYKKQRRVHHHFIEVKVCNPKSPFAYFKVKQLRKYKDMGNVLILFVMGYNTTDPRYILVTPEEVLNMNIEPEIIYGKETIKAHYKRFYWDKFQPYERDFNPLDKNYIWGR